jgi:hypothetical protein
MVARDKLALLKPTVALLVVLALGAAGFALMRLEKLTGLPDSYRLDLSRYYEIDSQLLHYEQTAQFAIPLTQANAIAVGPDDRIYVGGDRQVCIFTPEGQLAASIEPRGEVRCLAVGGADHAFPGRLYVGCESHIDVFVEAELEATWSDLGEKTLLTNLALTDEDVFVADAGNRIVLRLDLQGQLINRVGEISAETGSRGFIIPSPYFDLVAGQDGLVHVVNPGARRIETYTWDGHLELAWGKASSDIAGFFGCCNPAHVARLPDGKFVTSEKGIPRVKVYAGEGELDGVVAGPRELSIPPGAVGDPRSTQSLYIFDVAVDSQARILVLDSAQRRVRVFTKRTFDNA